MFFKQTSYFMTNLYKQPSPMIYQLKQHKAKESAIIEVQHEFLELFHRPVELTRLDKVEKAYKRLEDTKRELDSIIESVSQQYFNKILRYNANIYQLQDSRQYKNSSSKVDELYTKLKNQYLTAIHALKNPPKPVYYNLWSTKRWEQHDLLGHLQSAKEDKDSYKSNQYQR